MELRRTTQEEETYELESEIQLVKKAYEYITNHCYPVNASKKAKSIQRKAEKLIVRDRELYYKKKGDKQV